MFLKETGYKSVACISVHFHLVRCFVAVVSGLIHNGLERTVLAYALKGVHLDWNEEATHSQGLIKARRRDLVLGELRRNFTYCEGGDQVSARDVLDYLNWRDEAAKKGA